MTSLPWSWDGKRGNSIVAEWDEYHDWLAKNPHLNDESRRPPQELADAAWGRLERTMGLDVAAFVRRPGMGEMTPEQRAKLAPEARRAFVVAIDTALCAADSGRMLTRNALFDAIALRWSTNYRHVIGKPARSAYEMRETTIKAIWRELQLTGIAFDELWEAILGPKVQNPETDNEDESERLGVIGIYTVSRVKGRGYTVTTQKPETLLHDGLLGILGPATARWRVPRERYKRLRLADEGENQTTDTPTDDPVAATFDYLDWTHGNYKTRVAAETEYCQVLSGEPARDVMRQLEAATLYVGVQELRDDLAFMRDDLDRLSSALKDAGVSLLTSNVRPRVTIDMLVDKTTGAAIRPLRSNESVKSGGRIVRRARKTAGKVQTHVLGPNERVSRQRLPREWDRQISKLDLPAADRAGLRAKSDQYGEIAAQVSAFESIVKDLEDQGHTNGYLLIRSRYERLVNRRYQARDFWPSEVTGKDFALGAPGGKALLRTLPTFIASALPQASRRARWFKVSSPDREDEKLYDLAGYDISSSQIQVLSVFLGLDGLERLATDPDESFKVKVAKRVIERHHDAADEFELPAQWAAVQDESGLQDMLKTAVMTSLYGSQPDRVVRKLWNEHRPGLGSPFLNGGDHAEHMLDLLLKDEALCLGGVWRFLEACQTIATRLCDKYEYAGITFTDPFDGERFRWNPFRIRTKQVSDGHIYAKVPVGEPLNGDYPVDGDGLGRMIAPCLTHTLDAMFAAYVIQIFQQLSGEDVDFRDIVSIHDAWLVADHPVSTSALESAIDQAGAPWLRALGPVYRDLAYHAEEVGAVELADWFHDIQVRWQQRVADERWPRFRAAAAKMYLGRASWTN